MTTFNPIPHTSLQYVGVDITAKKLGLVVNPTADAVTMAFVAPGAIPASGDWQTATWETTVGPPAVYTALCLVGPGGTITLAAANYSVFVKVSDSPEVPVIPVSGLLSVT